MKKIVFITLLMVIGVIRVSAQEIDSLQENSTDARIEELSQKVVELSQSLEQLQEDYDYLNVQIFLKDQIFDVIVLYHDVRFSTYRLLDWCDSNFDIDLYLAAEESYNLERERYNQFVEHKDDFLELISCLSFSSERLDIINLLYDKFDFHITVIEEYLQNYKNSLDLYKKMGKGYRF